MKKLFIGLLSLLNFRTMAQLEKVTFVEDSSFIISDNIQNKYTGTYKDEKCYIGYFKVEYKVYRMILVDYYEKGVLNTNIPQKIILGILKMKKK